MVILLGASVSRRKDYQKERPFTTLRRPISKFSWCSDPGLDPAEFQRGFLGWIEALHEATERQVIAIDGKTLRRSFDRAKGKSALPMVHAWATANHLLLGQVAVDEKSNEITAIPKLLKLLEVSGAIVTIDAMGCQKEIARTIRGQGADYVLALKANHEHLFEQVVGFFDGACARGMKGDGIRYHREWSEGHGRTEARRCWATSDLTWLSGREEWKDLRSVVMIEAERFIGDSLSVETRYYLSSLDSDAELLNSTVRSHWGVENSLHWVLDVTFGEDRSRIKKENAPENFGLLRRLALCLLKLIFYSCASVFDVTPFLMERELKRGLLHSATSNR
jgi:predicted transposase YbfD/YdcC